jgi:hypothetical protein
VEKEEQQAAEAHLSGEEVDTHPNTLAADIEQDHTAAKEVRTVQIC